jgi:hypothetical protein
MKTETRQGLREWRSVRCCQGELGPISHASTQLRPAVINGVVAPPLLILIVLLASDRDVMGKQVSGRLSKTLTWAATSIMSIAAVALAATTLFPQK